MRLRVYPGAVNPTHEISLSDGVQTWGLRLDGGPAAIQEVPMTASTIQFSGGGTKFGDWEPGMSHIEQRTWEGGRGLEAYVDDPTRYYDAMNAWTMTPGKVFPAPQWRFAAGLRQAIEHLPGNVSWQALIGVRRWLAVGFTTGASGFDLDQAWLWLRRVGSPGALTVAVFSDSGGQPDAPLPEAQTEVDTAVVGDAVSQLVCFDLSSCGSLAANTPYHLVISARNSDSPANHWEVGADRSGGADLASPDGISWGPAGLGVYFRALAANIRRKWHLFVYQEALYAVEQRADGTPSRLHLNGDRGRASEGTLTSLTDSTKSWEAGAWTGSWACISAGTGAGQRSEILNSTDNTLTVSGWEQAPDATSEYIICGSDAWQDISPQSGDVIDGVVGYTAVVGEEVLLCQGLSVYILRMRWNPEASPPAHEFADDGANRADKVFPRVDAANGLHVWRVKASKSRMSKAAVPEWGIPYSYENDISVGLNAAPITNLLEHNGKLYAFKTDGRYEIKADGSVEKSIGEIGFVRSANNGEAVLSHGLFVYLSWGGFGLQRLYDSGYNCELKRVGPDSSGGLPQDRRGRVAALADHPGGILAAIDGGESHTSSVLMRPDGSCGWHEVFRAWTPGAQVNHLCWQLVGDSRPRLWISVGGELVYQDWPESGSHPLQDGGMRYQHEAVLETAVIDMGAARLPKFFKEFSVLTENLSAGVEIHLDYQVDEAVGGSEWTGAGSFHRSPEDVLALQRGNARRIRLRLRLVTDDCSVPPVLSATVLEAYARTPLKYQWNLRVKVGDCQPDLTGSVPDQDPDALLSWLKDAARQARAVRMRSIWEQLDNKVVVVEPPTLLRAFTNNLLGFWGGAVSLTLRES